MSRGEGAGRPESCTGTGPAAGVGINRYIHIIRVYKLYTREALLKPGNGVYVYSNNITCMLRMYARVSRPRSRVYRAAASYKTLSARMDSPVDMN